MPFSSQILHIHSSGIVTAIVSGYSIIKRVFVKTFFSDCHLKLKSGLNLIDLKPKRGTKARYLFQFERTGIYPTSKNYYCLRIDHQIGAASPLPPGRGNGMKSLSPPRLGYTCIFPKRCSLNNGTNGSIFRMMPGYLQLHPKSGVSYAQTGIPSISGTVSTV
jgi:hypothetical protein